MNSDFQPVCLVEILLKIKILNPCSKGGLRREEILFVKPLSSFSPIGGFSPSRGEIEKHQ
jgi:hypothetical protein